jgi:Tn3 transposase DDE domain
VKAEWEPDELIETWTLTGDEWALVLFALGTNMGIRQMAVTGEHGVGEAELRHVRAMYITRENLRAAVTTVVNATLEARDPAW